MDHLNHVRHDTKYMARSNDRKFLPWDRFNSWITCFCVVTFDLELGQVIEQIFPSHIDCLTDKEKANICYLAFPDSNTGCMGDTQYHFNIRSYQCSQRSNHGTNNLNDKDVPVVLQKDDCRYYGFVCFRQVKDASLKRGYFQKSLVLLSRLPFINLFSHLVGLVAPEYFENGGVAVETVCHQIDKWMAPTPGQTLQLPIMGIVLQVRVPSSSDKPGAVSSPDKDIVIQSSAVSQPILLPSLHEVNIFQCLEGVLPHLHLLWELVLLGEPIVVMAPSPSTCSQTVQALISLIQPLWYACDYRPYFTIHDSEFKEYTTRKHAPPSVILGVTNPFFAKTLQQWPHILRLGDMPSLSMSRGVNPSSTRKGQELKPGLYTKYKPILERDKFMMKKITKGFHGARPMEAQNALLRRYLLELTQSFIIPLERYIGSLMPLQRSISAFKPPPRIKQFCTLEFLETLGNFGPQLTSKLKGNWTNLFKCFFLSPNFESWFKHRRSEINRKLEVLHLEALCSLNVAESLSSKSETEIVDFYLQLKQKHARLRQQYPMVSLGTRRQLRAQIDAVLRLLPDDLRFAIEQC